MVARDVLFFILFNIKQNRRGPALQSNCNSDGCGFDGDELFLGSRSSTPRRWFPPFQFRKNAYSLNYILDY